MSNIPPVTISIIITSNTILSKIKIINWYFNKFKIYLDLIDSFNKRVEFRERCGLADDAEEEGGTGGGGGGGGGGWRIILCILLSYAPTMFDGKW